MANEYTHFIDMLPQQYPFRLIDEIVSYEEGKSLTAVKNITGTEWVFEGTLGKSDVFPETLIIEAAAQAAMAFYNVTETSKISPAFYLGKIFAEFMGQARIGDEVIFKTGEHKKLGKSGFMNIVCFIDSRSIAKIQIFYGLLG